ncbi:MAG: glycerol-3-phosphate dehydrogenase (NAD(P)+), partial [Porticoccus sp.]
MVSFGKIAVLGGGSFGTALANMVAENGHKVVLWMRSEENAKKCSHSRENAKYLPGCLLDSRLEFSADLETSLRDADVVFFSVPSNAFRKLANEASRYVASGVQVISTAKGIEAETFKLMSQV